MSVVNRAARLPTSILLAYGFPGMPIAFLLFPLFLFLPTYYAQDLGLGFGVVGGVLLAARILDAITDPFIGMVSDHTNLRWGRRRPWMVIGTPIVIVSMWFLFSPPPGVGAVHLLVWSFLLYFGGTMLHLVYNAWGAEISTNYHERTRITAFRELFVVSGTVVAVGGAQILGGIRGTPLTTADSLAFIAWLATIVLPTAVLIAVLMVPDRATPRPHIRLGRALRVVWQNKPFLRLLSAFLLNSTANGLPITLYFLFAQHVLKAGGLTYVILGIYFATAILSVPLWLRLSYRFGKHRMWCLSMLIVSAVFIWAPFLGEGDAYWLLAMSVINGLCLGGDLVLPPAMQADVVDFDELRTRQQRAGVYFAMWSVITKVALALAVGISFPILDLAGFQGASEHVIAETGVAVVQTPLALITLAILYSTLPVLLKLGAIALMWRFPIDAPMQARIRNLIVRRDDHKHSMAARPA